MSHLHGKGIAHMDLTPANILVVNTVSNKKVLKIADFGLSLLFNAGDAAESDKFLGCTPRYRDPLIEKWRADSLTFKTNPNAFGGVAPVFDAFKTDMWSFGIIVFEFLIGRDAVNLIAQTYNTQLQTDPSFPIGLEFVKDFGYKMSQTSDAYMCVKGLLTADHSSRMTSRECSACDWLRSTIEEHRHTMTSF